MNINDLKYAVINVTGLSINDEYFVWLGVNGGTGNTLPDREFSYLISQGGIPGSINDMWLDLLRASGYEGSLNDMLWDFWNNGGDFTLPIVNLQNMGLVHDAAGGDLVSGRSSTATFTDYEGRVVEVLANENRFDGANRIHSLNNGNGTQTITVISGNDYQISIGSGSDNGATAVLSGGATGTLTADNVSRLSFANGTPKTVSTTSLTVTITGSIVELMVEDVTGKANQAPNNYIGNVIYNTGVAGVFYSAYESANTVDANGVVTEVQGAAISPKPTLMYEPAATNLALHSDDFSNAQWGKIRVVVTANQDTAPNGLLTADLLTVSIDAIENFTHQAVTESNTKITASFFAKYIDNPWVHILVWDTSANGVRQWFNIQTGVLGIDTPFGTGYTVEKTDIELHANGYYRCVLTVNTDASASKEARFSVSDGDGQVNGTINKTAYLWRGQIESGVLSSSIPTTTVAVTRDADDPYIPVVEGVNHVDAQGMAIFRYKPGNSSIDTGLGLHSLRNIQANLLFDNGNGSLATFDDTSVIASTNTWSAGDEIIIRLAWSAAENEKTISAEVIGVGVSSWGVGAYDGSFGSSINMHWFFNNPFPNELVASMLYGSLPGGTIADAKTWLEANAQTATGGATELSALVTDAFDQLTTDNGSPLTVQE